MERVDSFIIDRLFQPVSDSVARYVSCYGIAAFLLTGAVPLHFMAEFAKGYWVAMFVSLTWLPVLVYRAYKLEQAPPSNLLPLERVHYVLLRVGLLTFQALFVPFDYWMIQTGGIWVALMDFGWWIIVVALYFMACRRKPPKPKRAVQTVWGVA